MSKYRIDSHQNFWRFDPSINSLSGDELKIVQRDFMPEDLYPILQHNDFSGCLTAQSRQTPEETEFLLSLTKENCFIKAVIGWIDLEAGDLDNQLQFYTQFPKLKGFSYISQKTDELAFSEEFIKGLECLQKYNYSFDFITTPAKLKYLDAVIERFPNQKFIISFLADPLFVSQDIESWKSSLTNLAKHKNLYCKISGLNTSINWGKWKLNSFDPYLDIVFDSFGVNRVLYASDWPVCLLSGGYNQTIKIIESYISNFSEQEQDLFWGRNAEHVYSLTD